MTNERHNAEWLFETFMELEFSGKKTWFVRATRVDSNVQWVYFQSFTDSNAPQSLASNYQAAHGHQTAWTPKASMWERRGLPGT